ncbi:hypothetical protein BVC80_1651g82 [Macleaya cordata]|uniref:Uncharacterized protein n=1 Tax=Macleaya cordata TaxID=56857 RepID=A0A200PZJ5_MACCD|nr:hypothetical protein BVC80_1651g82 [Macleaya cordata]
MASSLIQVYNEEQYSSKGLEEEDEELFEIDFEAANKIPPSGYWEGCLNLTTTGNIALLANCLLPISDVSNAVPTVSYGWGESAVKNASRIVMMIEFVPERFWGSPLAFGLYDTYRKSLLGSIERS